MNATRSFMLRRITSVSSSLLKRGFADEATSAAGKLNLNFLIPSKALKKNLHADMVIIPSANGVMGVLPDHVPTVAQLKPGSVTIHHGDEVENYVISGGFAFIHKDRTDICAIEAALVEDIDPEAVSAAMANAQSLMSSSSNEAERTEAQIALEMYTAMQVALGKQ